MTPSEAGLKKFLSEHPNLKPDELHCLMYRAGYSDGAIDTINKIVKSLQQKAETDV